MQCQAHNPMVSITKHFINKRLDGMYMCTDSILSKYDIIIRTKSYLNVHYILTNLRKPSNTRGNAAGVIKLHAFWEAVRVLPHIRVIGTINTI